MESKGLPYAEDIGHYWQTSNSSPDSWLAKTTDLIKKSQGKIIAEGFGSAMGRAAFMLTFEIGGEKFKLVWPVLPSKTKKDLAARRQAATLMYYDVKAKLMTASVLGFRDAFFQYLLLPDGRTTGEIALPELSQAFPQLLTDGR
ncbi:MAG: hypothetical protein IMZ53_16795 [Thermoplasmata archaeon]|nr:hypothetical protein [Thermoplasmata archaeon]